MVELHHGSGLGGIVSSWMVVYMVGTAGLFVVVLPQVAIQTARSGHRHRLGRDPLVSVVLGIVFLESGAISLPEERQRRSLRRPKIR